MNTIIIFSIVFTLLVAGFISYIRKNRRKKDKVPPPADMDSSLDHIGHFDDLS